jgi:NADH:ubiquinone oxidoreductase subunit E
VSPPEPESLRVTICVGSSCYVRGSDQLAAALVSLLGEHGLEDRIEITGAFCMDACTMGVSVKVGDGPCRTVTPENAAALFHNEILPAVRGERY